VCDTGAFQLDAILDQAVAKFRKEVADADPFKPGIDQPSEQLLIGALGLKMVATILNRHFLSPSRQQDSFPL
jgi:hypothetical protein